MFCSTCSKLALLVTQRVCIRCNAAVFNNLSVLCEQCSNTNKICSICLKKIQNPKPKYQGCGHCGR